MQSYAEKIEEQLYELVRNHFKTDLAFYALQFLEHKCKEKHLFGGLTVLHYRMFGGQSEHIYRVAAAMELAILSLDIFDDLQDEDQPNIIWRQCPQAIAMNAALGFVLLARQSLMSSELDKERLLQVEACWDRSLLTAVNGQTTDLLNRIATEEEYYQMIREKSSSLVVMACMTGTLLSTGYWNETVEKYACELGFASQLKNDIRDLVNWDSKNDFLQRKRTLLTLYLMKYAPLIRNGFVIILRAILILVTRCTVKKKLKNSFNPQEHFCILKYK
ncbi:polyprenyl synthetase family protein [Paenibacillus pini]|uniref:Transcriptional regulator n=1 Tax=Paenibacillus pini JCM 16418 TaxID=1236976 RepID=W7YFS8_9BACL|nr:polyprenyl synthetase family protein [Paenibacillus pini]GAF06378.1 transcriptional regulator [Paenibacillus pini JCM 16418]